MNDISESSTVRKSIGAGSCINLPAVLIVAVVTAVLVKGISESAGFNALMVFIKVAAVLFVILVGAFYINPANWQPFAPYGWTGVSFFGIPVHGRDQRRRASRVGMLAGAAIIFFAYIGFDSVSTHAEEAKNPQRDVPIGIIASLMICTVLYIAVVAVLTGMVQYDELEQNAGVSDAFKQSGPALGRVHHRRGRRGGHHLGAAGDDAQRSARLPGDGPRRAGAPKASSPTSIPRFRTPWKSTILIGVFVAVLAGLLPIDALLHLTNIGTLFAFVDRLRRGADHAPHQPGGRAAVPLPAGAAGADPGHRLLPAADVLAAGGELVAACSAGWAWAW